MHNIEFESASSKMAVSEPIPILSI